MARRNRLLILILTIGVFGILNTEMGIIGLLPAIADRFDVSISQAGWLVSSFALAVALSGPILPMAFSGMNRKAVMLLVLGVFVLGNAVSVFTDNFAIALAARVIPAFLHPVYCSLALTVAAGSVRQEEAPKAVAKVFIGVSAGMALEDAYKAGKVKAIGLSNFLQDDVENIVANCEIKPMVNQILAHVSNTPLELIEFCRKNDILVEAYSPIAHGAILDHAEIKEIAEHYGVSVAQLCLRYAIQLGLVVLPKTANPEHMRINAELHFVISETDMENLKNVEHIQDNGEHSFFPVFGGKLK